MYSHSSREEDLEIKKKRRKKKWKNRIQFPWMPFRFDSISHPSVWFLACHSVYYLLLLIFLFIFCFFLSFSWLPFRYITCVCVSVCMCPFFCFYIPWWWRSLSYSSLTLFLFFCHKNDNCLIVRRLKEIIFHLRVERGGVVELKRK